MTITEAISALIEGRHLSSEDMYSVFTVIMEGQASGAQIGALLIGLRIKGETSAEIAGAARAMRSQALPLNARSPETLVDTCGTGGDGSGSANISTIAAIVTAAAGGRVAKHGNRALSSKAGSADVLEALGVSIEMSPSVARQCLDELGITFLFAPHYHAATRHAAAPRRELGTRTIFNLLGPLTNPARAANQIIGVFSADWVEPVATALGALGSNHVFVVHGEGGLDEVAVRGKTEVAEWSAQRGTVRRFQLCPKDFGLAEADPAGLAGGDIATNADIFRRVLAGDNELGAVRTAAILEAALALVAGGVATDMVDGAKRAAIAIDSGAAVAKLAAWAGFSK